MQGGGSTPSSCVLKFCSIGLAVPAAPGSTMSATDTSNFAGAPVARPALQYEAPYAGTLRNLMARVNAALGAGIGVTYSIWVNEGAASALACTISGAAQVNNSDLVNSVAVAQGDRIYCGLTRSAGVPPAVDHGATVELVRA